MAKFYNNRVKTGKLAGSVFAIRNGITIERAYQPIVANPSTPAQVASRAKLKLLSQLAAVMAPYIAIPREGAVSTRNLFTKSNYAATSFTNNEATISLASVKLTKSVVSLPAITATRASNNLNVALEGTAQYGNLGIDRVVYVAFLKQSDNTLRAVDSIVVSEAGAGNDYAGTMRAPSAGDMVVYAYAVRDNTDAARVAFGNLEVLSGQSVASLLTTRSLTESDVTLTETRFAEVANQA